MDTPVFIIDETRLRKNCEKLARVKEASGCKVLLAQKAYSAFETYPIIAEYLDGTTASGLYEARLGKEHFGKETHVYSPAYKESELKELLGYADHVTFNSPTQVRMFAGEVKAAGKSVGMRVNPECSTQEGHEIYDPCAPFSRLGATLAAVKADEEVITLLDGLHFHTLCEQNADALKITLDAFDRAFGKYARGMKWINLGGGHHITRDDYDTELLIDCIKRVRDAYGCEVYLEPGEAVVLNAGTLIATGSKYQRDVMKETKDSPELAYKDIFRVGKDRNDPVLVKMVTEKVGTSPVGRVTSSVNSSKAMASTSPLEKRLDLEELSEMSSGLVGMFKAWV